MTTGRPELVQRLLSSDSKYSEVGFNVVLTRIKVLGHFLARILKDKRLLVFIVHFNR